jgi:hypothetical protein
LRRHAVMFAGTPAKHCGEGDEQDDATTGAVP